MSFGFYDNFLVTQQQTFEGLAAYLAEYEDFLKNKDNHISCGFYNTFAKQSSVERKFLLHTFKSTFNALQRISVLTNAVAQMIKEIILLLNSAGLTTDELTKEEREQ
jgi:hypothetical protein